MRWTFFLVLLLPVCGLHLFGDCLNEFYLAPQWYHVKRTKEGGTKQQGNLAGVELGYDTNFWCFGYFGAEASIAYGTLKGHSGNSDSLRSDFTDFYGEGRLGFSCAKFLSYFSLIPFIGAGYAVEQNNFKDPSPITAHFKTYYPYFTAGFLSSMPIWDSFEIGINFKAKLPFDPKCKINHDRNNKAVTQNISERVHYRVELPMVYCRLCHCPFAFGLNPFYELRQYGSHINYPYDYKQTKFSNLGAAFQISFLL